MCKWHIEGCDVWLTADADEPQSSLVVEARRRGRCRSLHFEYKDGQLEINALKSLEQRS